MDSVHGCLPLKAEPSSNSEYAYILLRRNQSPKKNLTIQDAQDMQVTEEIAALDPSQESEKKLAGPSKPVESSFLDANGDSDPMDLTTRSSTLFKRLTLTVLLLLLLTSKHFGLWRLQPLASSAGESGDSDGVHSDAYDGDSDEVVSDKDRNSAYAKHSVGHDKK